MEIGKGEKNKIIERINEMGKDIIIVRKEMEGFRG